jgi:hypothetical protein
MYQSGYSVHASPSAFADAPDSANEQLPTDKLACRMDAAAPRRPTVLVSCGSFNPPTIMHLRMFDLATAALAQVHLIASWLALLFQPQCLSSLLLLKQLFSAYTICMNWLVASSSHRLRTQETAGSQHSPQCTACLHMFFLNVPAAPARLIWPSN